MSLTYFAIFALYTLILVLIIYGFFFANPSSKGISGRFATFITRTIPRKMKEVIRTCCGNGVIEVCGSVSDYILHKRNPILICAYLLVINAAFVGWLLYGEPQLPTKLASKVHSYIGTIGVIICQITFYLACTTSPGVITQETVNYFNHVPYDGLLYVSGSFCKTCRVPKLARSKHCSMCGFCVPIFDHHCVWLNQCVGELNHKYFILFLVVNSSFFIYATYVVTLVLLSEVYERDLMNAVFYNHITREEFRADIFIVGQYIIGKNAVLFGVWLIAFVMGLAVGLFLMYHLYLLWAGTTTNETYKWDYVRKVHKELTKSFMTYKAAQKYGDLPKTKKSSKKNSKVQLTSSDTEVKEVLEGSSGVNTNGDIGNQILSTAENRNSSNNSSHENASSSLQKALSAKQSGEHEFVGCVPSGFRFNEPHGYKKQMVRAIMDKLDEDDEDDFPEYLEEDPGPMPVNIYNIGFLRTLWRVFAATSPSARDKNSKKKK